MPKMPLLILVEGPTDESFFKRVVLPKMRGVYGEITVVPYARMQPKLVCGMFSVFLQEGGDYLLVCDRDSHVHSCRTECKTFCTGKYAGLDTTRVRIVEEAIESWFVAVADDKLRKSRKWVHTDTSGLSKADFHSMPSGTETPYDLQQDILASPDLASGRGRNASLEYFFLHLP